MVTLMAACHARAPVTSCADSLAGEWAADDGKTWVLLDGSGGVEGYPHFADPVVPRALALGRDGRGGLAGTISRRFEQGPRTCTTKAPAHVIACADDAITIVLGDPPVPVFAADDQCVSPAAATRRERWRRVR